MSAEDERLKQLRAQHKEIMKLRAANASAKKATASKPPSGWMEGVAEDGPSKKDVEAQETKRKLIAAVKARLLEIWREAYTANKKDYARTVALLEVPEATKLPKGYRITREDTDTYLILKVYTPEGELLHLSIPKPGAPAQFGPHFTQGTYHEDVKLEGGRKTRRLRSKQKRTRRIIRRLVRA